MRENGLAFLALEGLRGTGKSTIAPMLAQALGAEHLPTIPVEYGQARAYVDQHSHIPDARGHLFLSAAFVSAERARALLQEGRSVVIDSFLQRTIATHRAYGAALNCALPPGLPAPTTVQLTCSPKARSKRLSRRVKATTWWDDLADQVADRIEHEYSKLPGIRIDTTDQEPHQTVATILAAIR